VSERATRRRRDECVPLRAGLADLLESHAILAL
jgi:hypothetical protein